MLRQSRQHQNAPQHVNTTFSKPIVQQALNAARARMHDPAWKERYHARAGIEGTLSQGVRAFGMRQSRYIGLARTGLQQACTAAAMNVSRIVNWLDRRPRAKTRVTRFKALAQAA